jgi:hypothetical protein
MGAIAWGATRSVAVLVAVEDPNDSKPADTRRNVSHPEVLGICGLLAASARLLGGVVVARDLAHNP